MVLECVPCSDSSTAFLILSRAVVGRLACSRLVSDDYMPRRLTPISQVLSSSLVRSRTLLIAFDERVLGVGAV